MEYMKNIDTGRVFPSTPILKAEAARYGRLVPCDENGISAPVDPGNDLEKENARLKKRIIELEAELARYQTPDKVEVPEEVKLAPEDVKPEEPNKMQAMVDAIGQLEEGNPDHWVKSGARAGKPRVEALEAFAQIPEISAEEADEAWKRYQG